MGIYSGQMQTVINFFGKSVTNSPGFSMSIGAGADPGFWEVSSEKTLIVTRL